MIPFETACKIIRDQIEPLSAEMVELDKLPGRVLADAICAPFPLPRFDQSAMDGYALKTEDFASASADHPVPLTVCHEIRAGDPRPKPILPKHVARIMTGAPMPPGADAVVMREEVEDGDNLRLRRRIKSGENVRRAGEEFPLGATVLSAGTVITPPVIGMIATLGLDSARVFRFPKISLIVTGDELKEPGEELREGQIYNSNKPALTAALRALGVTDVRSQVVSDEKDQLLSAIQSSLTQSDIVITIGGVSAGDYDFIRSVCGETGVRELFWKVAIKPGKPVYFGYYETKSDRRVLVFGLPGNPVSALVTFHLLVRPAILRMAGIPPESIQFQQAYLEVAMKKPAGRLEFARGFLSESDGRRSVMPVRGQGSHMLGGLVAANCLIIFPAEERMLQKGSFVSVLPIKWTL